MEKQVQFSSIELFIATLALMLGSFVFVLDYTIANVAIPYIAGGLAVGVSEGIYVITSFAVGNAIFVPMTGWFSLRFGMVKVLSVSFFLFTVFSFFCGAAPNLLSLVLFRFLQGAAAGPLLPLSQGVLVLIQPKERINTILAIFSMVVLTAPVFGPIVGGYFCIYWDWAWIFYINVPVGLLCTFAIFKILMPLNGGTPEKKVDLISFSLLFISMAAFQVFLDKGEEWDWFGSERIWILAVLAFLGIFYLISWSFMAKEPLLELSLFRIRNFAIVNITMFASYFMYLGGVVLIPLWLQTQMGYDALAAGIAVAPIGLGACMVSVIVAKAIKKIGSVWTMIIGFFIIGLSNLYVTYFPAGIDRYHIMISRLILGLGVGFWITPMLSMASLSLPQAKLASGLGLFHTIRGLSGAMGASLCSTIYLRRLIHQHSNLISHITPFNQESNAYIEKIKNVFYVDRFIERQASAIAINEVFYVMAIALFLLIFVMMFALKAEKKEKESA